ncbi:MAG: serine/threonine protein kinase [Deltaproteobacteria bacterium]|nr:MAG: serine/threonine protein kinase [Deltaproteobacteria bacterium]
MLKSRADCPHAFCPDENQLMALTQGLLSDDEVRQLDNVLDQCTHCSELMVALAQDLSPYNSGDYPEPDALPPVAIGRYNVKQMLGSGGMGVIYEAYDEDNQRPVALKLIRPDVLDPYRREAHRARMLREARLLASLHHPNIPNIYEVGTWNDQVFLAMQLVSGTNMRQWLDQANPDWTDIVAAYLRAGEGVVAAHNANIVHRDIKPDNILVEDTGNVYITDFGLARLDQTTISSIGMHSAPHRPPALLSLTGTGDILGTPAYMPPEQYKGQGVSKRSDQFSFCVSLYEALYGMRPFAGQTMEELIQAAQDGRVFRPRFSEIPNDVLQVLIRGMHPVPRERYGSMRELLTALDNAMFQTGSARPRFRSGAIAATILFLIGMLLFLVWGVDNLPFSSWNGTTPVSSSLKQQTTNVKTRSQPRSSNQARTNKSKRKLIKSKWLPKNVQINPNNSVFVRKGVDGTAVTPKNLSKTLLSTGKTKRRRRKRRRKKRRWKKRRWNKRRYRKRRRRRRRRRRYRKNKKSPRKYTFKKG